jgi:hypothetical protein
MARSENKIQEFIDDIPVEFEALKPKAEKLLDAHRQDVINAFLAAGRKTADPVTLIEWAEEYYERKHITK